MLTSVWGRQHLDWWKAGSLKSLMWPKNREALNGADWAFLTKQEHVDEIKAAVVASGIKIRDLEFYDMTGILEQHPHAGGSVIKEVILTESSKCLTFNAQMLLAPPDTIIGDGSIQNMREVGDQRDVVVFAAHVRVHPDILDVVSEKPLSNANLVYESFKRLHKSWDEAQFGPPKANSYIGGVAWRFLEENLYSVQHRLPTPYLINWTPEDQVYYRGQLHWGCIDHQWPGEVLVPAQRQRLIGSSDGAFMAEITPHEVNIPPSEHVRSDEPDLFWRNQKHNIQNRMQSLIFRGEPLES